jgi:SAM-dependent methyltransferase
MERTRMTTIDSKKNEEDFYEKLSDYKWYHRIEVCEGIYTTPEKEWDFDDLWNFILASCLDIDFRDKRVLDVGCRDGLFSFFAEKNGAKEVIGIDNWISKGATEFLIPHFQSKVKMHEINLYDLTPQEYGSFDIILCFGVLYHLRLPFLGLSKLVDCLTDSGRLYIESGMLTDERFDAWDFLYCPVESSPYKDGSSCTFFNKKALTTTMRSLGCKLIRSESYKVKTNNMNVRRFSRLWHKKSQKIDVGRQFFEYELDQSLIKSRTSMWFGTYSFDGES